MTVYRWVKDARNVTAVATAVEALLAANMTVLTNPNLTMHTWMPSRPRLREYVFLACNQRFVRSGRCMQLCRTWRAGYPELGCERVWGRKLK